MTGDAALTKGEGGTHGRTPGPARDGTVVMGAGAARLLGLSLLLVLAAMYSAGCLDNGSENGSELQVAVTILPQEEIARAVGGEKVCITVVVPPGVEPHTYEPSAGQIARLSQADMYFRLGRGLLPFEDALVDRLLTLNPDLVVVDTSEGVSLIRVQGQDHGAMQGGDPHVWLSPSNLRIMAGHMAEGFSIIDPGRAADYAAGKEAYIRRVDATDTNIRDMLSGMEGKPFLVFHEAWGYFAREYGLVQVAVGAEGKEPGARELSSLITFARENGIRVVFAEPQYDTRGSEVIAREIHGSVVLIDPLAPDTLSNLERVASAISLIYGEGNGGAVP